MTVETDYDPEVYAGDGVTTFFAVDWEFIEETTLVVQLILTDGVTIVDQVLNSDYTVAGGNGEKGSVTMTVPPAAGEQLVISRFNPRKQLLDLETNQDLPAESLEQAYDRGTLVDQEITSDEARNLKLAITTNIPDAIFPDPVADYAVFGKADESGWDNRPITDFGQVPVPIPVSIGGTGATDAATARANLAAAGFVDLYRPPLIVNGGMRIWDLGTFISNAINQYTANEWFVYGGPGTIDVSEVTGLANTESVTSSAYRFQRRVGDTNTSNVGTSIAGESVDSRPYRGRTMTMSFRARKGPDFSSASSVLTAAFQSGTGTDQRAPAFSGAQTVASLAATLTTEFQEFSLTGVVPTDSNQLGALFNYTPTGTAGGNDYFDICDVRMEHNNIATPFRPMRLAEEEELCRRHYQIVGVGGLGTWISTTDAVVGYVFTTEMRVTPSALLLTSSPQIDEVGVATRTGSGSTIVSGTRSTTGSHERIGGFTGATAQNAAAPITAQMIAYDARF